MSAPSAVAPPAPEAKAVSGAPLVLEYREPAREWGREALPIGNGRLGAMLLGFAESAHVQFNESSLWTGGDNPSGGYDDVAFGNYQAFGDLQLKLRGAGEARDFLRGLELASAVHRTSFGTPDGTRHVQEAFASYPDQVIVLRATAVGPSALAGSLRLRGEHDEAETVLAADGALPAGLRFEGRLSNGLRYAAEARAVAEGCALASAAPSLEFSGCRALTVYLAAATDYAMASDAGFRGEAPAPRVDRVLRAAVAAGYDAIRARHAADHAALFGRVAVSFGSTPDAVKRRPMDARVAGYEPGGDPELLATLFQYGRYLLIASSRRPGLPANLQGIWNRENGPPWHSDYHSNINTQMNYWGAEPANLAECHLPLFDLLDASAPGARAATRAAFGKDAPGFTYRTSHNVFGGQGWEWNTPASAWYAMHYYEHWAFGGDREFLRKRAWPYLAEVSEFWLHRLKRRDDGALVAPDGWSPEHGPREEGVTYDQELVRELFTNTLAAGAALGRSDPLLQRVAAAREKLLAPRVGRWGQLQEWAADRDDPQDRHRHTSHLVGVYPGRQISVAATPGLAKAAEISLRARGDTGDSRRSWTWPWRCALWARLGTTECHRMLDGLVAHNLLPNLITTHPPLQLDGSLGLTGAVSEVLLQSHAGEIQLLPGVDFRVWPAGSFHGLRARGGFEVSARWAGGRVVEATLLSRAGGRVNVGGPARVLRVEAPSGPVKTALTERGASRFETRAGETYRVVFE